MAVAFMLQVGSLARAGPANARTARKERASVFIVPPLAKSGDEEGRFGGSPRIRTAGNSSTFGARALTRRAARPENAAVLRRIHLGQPAASGVEATLRGDDAHRPLVDAAGRGRPR